MRINFYPLDFSIRNEREVLIFARQVINNEPAEHILLIDELRPSFYAIGNEKTAMRIINSANTPPLKYMIENKKFLGKDVEAIKFFMNNKREINQLKKELEKMGIRHFETDIPSVRKYLYDSNIIPLTLCSAEVNELTEESKNSKVRVFKIRQIQEESTEVFDRIRILGVDIETYGNEINFDKNPIIMISFYGENINKVITWFKEDNPESDYKKPNFVEIVNNEGELLKRFEGILEDYKPDLIVGYSSDNFDFPYIKRRAAINNIELKIGLDNSNLIIKRGVITTARIKGIIHIDLLRVIRNFIARNLKTNRYDLNSVSKEILNEEKDNVELNELSKTWDNLNRMNKFYYYNLKDSELAYKLIEKILPMLLELVKITESPLYDISRMSYSQIVEGYLIRRSSEFNEIIPNKPGREESVTRARQSYEGAFVFEPEPGIYDKIIVFDFKSLYPTIISSHNISPDTLNCDCCKDDVNARVPGLNYWFCIKRKGFIPKVIEELIRRRATVKSIIRKLKAEGKESPILKARQEILKKIANSMYGYMGFPRARWYCIECAESVTAYGRYYIQKVIRKAEERGFKIIYADTDSIFINLRERTMEDAFDFVDKINSTLPGIMKLEFQDYYSKGIFVSSKSGDSGAKKKYALLKENGKLKITGLEFVRRNYCDLAKEVQMNTLKIILKDNDKKKAFDYVKSTIDKVRKKEIPKEKLIMKTQLQKPTDSYVSEGPHVILAKKMQEEGILVKPGTIISYIVKPGKGKIGERVELPEKCKEDEYDDNYYIRNQIVPVVEKILELTGYSKEELLEDKEQERLGKFF